MLGGAYSIENRLDEIDEKGKKATETEKRLYTVLEVAREMVKRGYYFERVHIMHSSARDFTLTEDNQGLRMPFVALDGLGYKVADSIITARDEKLFSDREDVKKRTAVSNTVFNKLDALDAFGDLPDTPQMSLF
jgi:DNA polymerase-3 subunit alpha (Gram-positive type)